MTRTHVLKTLPRYWRAVDRGEKTFEVRKDDRAYAEGDILILRLYDPTDTYGTGSPRACSEKHFPEGTFTRCKQQHNDILVQVSYVLPGGKFGIDPDYVVLGIHKMRMSS